MNNSELQEQITKLKENYPYIIVYLFLHIPLLIFYLVDIGLIGTILLFELWLITLLYLICVFKLSLQKKIDNIKNIVDEDKTVY